MSYRDDLAAAASRAIAAERALEEARSEALRDDARIAELERQLAAARSQVPPPSQHAAFLAEVGRLPMGHQAQASAAIERRTKLVLGTVIICVALGLVAARLYLDEHPVIFPSDRPSFRPVTQAQLDHFVAEQVRGLPAVIHPEAIAEQSSLARAHVLAAESLESLSVHLVTLTLVADGTLTYRFSASAPSRTNAADCLVEITTAPGSTSPPTVMRVPGRCHQGEALTPRCLATDIARRYGSPVSIAQGDLGVGVWTTPKGAIPDHCQ